MPIELLDISIQNVTPTVFDDELSQLESLGAMHDKVNEIVDELNNRYSTNLVPSVLEDVEGADFSSGGTATFLNGRLDKWEQRQIDDETVMSDAFVDAEEVDFTPAGQLNGRLTKWENRVLDAEDNITAAADRLTATEAVANAAAKKHWVDVSQTPYLVTGDGSDETEAMQDALDYATANKRVFYVPSYLTVSVSNLVATEARGFGIRVEGVIKFINSAPAGASILKLDTCDDVTIHFLNADANVANNGVTINEHLHILRLLSCNRVFINTIKGTNPTGDVVYVSNCNDVIADKIYGYGTNTGRNTLSIIKGSRMQFANIMSIGVGTTDMPCGVDCEPNFSTDAITDIQFGNVYVEGIGSGGFVLYNGVGANCRKVSARNVVVNKTSPTGVTRHAANITNFSDVQVNITIREIQSTPADLVCNGLYIDGGIRLDIHVDIDNVYAGVYVGMASEVRNLKLSGTITRTKNIPIEIKLLSKSVIEGLRISDCDYAEASNVYGFKFSSTAVVSYLTIKNCNFAKETYGWRFMILAGTLDNVIIKDCDFSAWPDLTSMISGSFTTTYGMRKQGNRNLNYRNTAPDFSYWMDGDVVENTEPAIAGSTPNKYVIIGWRRVTSGTGHVLNTDWVEMRTLTGA